MNESRNKYPPIDTKNDRLMVEEALRQPKVIFIKRNKLTKEERRELKLLKANAQPLSKSEYVKRSRTSLTKLRLTVYFLNVKKESNFKTTTTVHIYRDDVEDFLQSKVNEGLQLSKIYLDTKPFEFIPKPKNF